MTTTPTRQQRSQWYSEASTRLAELLSGLGAPLSEASKAAMLKVLRRQFPELSLSESWMCSSIKQAHRSRDLGTRPRSPEQWDALFPRYPMEADGFACALEPTDEAAIAQMMETYGCVVVRVLSDDECDASRDAIFEEINGLPNERRQQAIDWRQPHTWEQHNWPTKGKYLLSDPAFHQRAFDNRTHEVIYHVFSVLWGHEHLMVNIDRWGVARGTRGLVFPQADGSSQRVDREDWSLELTRHWDYNPWLFVEEMASGLNPGYQGLVAFVDQDLETGCHLTLPGGVRFLEQWCQENPHPSQLGRKRRSHRPKADDPILEHMQPIPIRKGEMVLWSWGQLHSVVPNTNHKMRLHQYIGMFPAEDVEPFYAAHENFSPRKVLPRFADVFSLEDIELSDLGRRLLGAQPWTG